MDNRPPVAIVTGAARGIGRACARLLATKGFDLALVDLMADAAQDTASEIHQLGRQASVYASDVAQFGAAQDVVQRIMDRWGGIDVLVNNAGRSMPKGLLEITEEEWDSTLDTNLKGCFNWCRAVAPVMLAQDSGGRIINMSSLSAFTGGVTSAVSKFAYAASKAGIIGLTRGLAKELGPRIAVNAVCPGFIQTELTRDLLSGARAAELARSVALGRLGTPEDVAQLVAFLATVEPNFISGEALRIDGFQWVT